MASYEKIVKYIVERFQDSLSPLGKIVENQEEIIRQNAQLQAILNKIYNRTLTKSDENVSGQEK